LGRQRFGESWRMSKN